MTEFVIWFFCGVGVMTSALYLVAVIHHHIERTRRPLVPPPDPSTKRGAQLADEQARYIRRTERQ